MFVTISASLTISDIYSVSLIGGLMAWR